jgi:hypothetical protein
VLQQLERGEGIVGGGGTRYIVVEPDKSLKGRDRSEE